MSKKKKEQGNEVYWLTEVKKKELALVVQTLDSAIYRINHYPADKYSGNRLMHQSIPPAPSPAPPGQPRGICQPCQSRGRGFSQFNATRGPGIGQPRGHHRGFDTHVVNFKTRSTWRISEIKTRCFSCFYYTKVKDLKGLFKLVYYFLLPLFLKRI